MRSAYHYIQRWGNLIFNDPMGIRGAQSSPKFQVFQLIKISFNDQIQY